MTGKQVRRLREKLDRTREEIAATALCSYRTLENWETGRRTPRRRIRTAIEAALEKFRKVRK